MRLSVMLVVTVVIQGAAVVLLSPGAGGYEALRGAGGAVTTVLKAASSPPHCSLLLLTNSASASATFLKEMAELGAPWAVVVLEVTAGGGQDANTTRSQMVQAVQMARQVRRGSWCMTAVVLSHDPIFLTSFAHQSRRGRLLVWATKLLLVTTSLSLPQLRELLQSHWTFSMMNGMIINLKDESRWDVYHWLPFTSAGSRMVRSAVWSPSTGLVGTGLVSTGLVSTGLVSTNTTTFFPDKFANFHGAAIPVSTVELMPLFAIVETSSSDGTTVLKYIGREYLMLLAVAQALNFTPEVRNAMNITEGVKKLVTGEALLLPVRMMPLPQILAVADYTFYIDRATLTFAMAKPPTKPRWQGSYYPFTSQVWMATVASLFLLPPILLVVLHTWGRIGDGGARRILEAQRVILEVFGVLMAQDLLRRIPWTASVRILVSAWMVFAFVMGVSYRGNLTAFLTIPKYPARPETLDQLAEANVHSKFMRNVTWFHDYFTSSPLKSSRGVGDRSSLVNSTREGMIYIADTRGAFFYERYNMMLMIAESFTGADGWSSLYVARENVLPNYSSWLLPHDAPYKDNLDKVLSRIIEAGLKEKWLDDVMRDTMRNIRQKKRDREKPQVVEGSPSESINIQQPLALTHLQGPFFLLLLGLMTSVCAFVGELLASVGQDIQADY